MTVVPKCPSCGFESAEIRCPRCNTLKLVGCSGVCSACASSCASGPVPAPPSAKPRKVAEDTPTLSRR
jgi:hypothetical protein